MNYLPWQNGTNLPQPGAQNTPQVPASNRPQKRESHAQHLCARQYLEQNYRLCQSREGSLFLVNPSTNKALSIDGPEIVDEIKAQASYRFGVRFSTSAVKDGIAAIRGSNHLTFTVSFFYMRVVQASSAVTLQVNNHFFYWIDAYQTTLCRFPLMQNGSDQNPFYAIATPPRAHITPKHLNNIPYYGNSADNIYQLFNATKLPYDQRLLIISWLVLSLLPDRHLFALELTGEPQSGKTEAQEALLSLIDPQDRMIRRPRRSKDIEPELLSSYILALDGIEHLDKEAQSLMVSCLEGYAYRSKGRQPISFDIKKPIVFNAIESVITDSELAKRSVSIEAPPQTLEKESTRYTDQQWHILMEQAFSGLLILTSRVLAHLPFDHSLARTVPREQRDFCLIGTLVASILENDSSLFWQQYDHNQYIQLQKTIDDHTIASAIQEWLEFYPEGKTDTVQNWMSTLKPFCDSDLKWPGSARDMSERLKEAHKQLEPMGIDIIREGKRGSYGRFTITKKIPKKENSHETTKNSGGHDDRV